jgi:NitT/TauT family transport system substrate-binding protein
MRKGFALLVLIVLVGAAGCARPATPQLTHVRLPMGFVANVQFAPWYVAVEKGYFAAEGIELEFDYGDWETKGVQLVATGWTPFAIASGDQVLRARAQGLPVVMAVNWFRRFPVAVVALKESGIQAPADLVGRKVGTPETFGAASYIGWRALAAAVGLEDQDVQLEVIGYAAVENLVTGRVDAAVVYANNEPVQLAQRGYDYVLFPVADYVPLISNGIMTNEETLQEKPELVRAFARAFLKGLEDTLADPHAAFEICKKYVEGLDQNEAIQRAVLEATLPYWQGENLGTFDPAAWQKTAEVLLQMGLLADAVEAEKAFTNDYLP